jgi:hypothetical protein
MSNNLPASFAGVAWKVINAAMTTDQDSTGRYAKGWEVTYQVPSGHTGTVFLAGATLNPDQVKAAVNAAAANLSGVVGLTSGG